MGGLKHHVPTRQLVAFMLGRAELTEQEGEHLTKCEYCFASMVKATREHLHEVDSAEYREERKSA